MCDYLFLLDANPSSQMFTVDAPSQLVALAEQQLLLSLNETEILLSQDPEMFLFSSSPEPPPAPEGGTCPHMTALMDSYNQPIRESATGFVILVETH